MTTSAETANAGTPEHLSSTLFGITGRAQRLEAEYDDNFLVTTAQGDRYVLKVARRGESRALLELQETMLARLRASAPEIEVPQPRPAVDGSSIAEIVLDGEPRLVRLMRFVPGRLLSDVRVRDAALLRGVGHVLATIDKALFGLEHPAGSRELEWDLRRAGAMRRFLPAVPDARRRDLLTTLLDRFDSEIRPQLDGLRE